MKYILMDGDNPKPKELNSIQMDKTDISLIYPQELNKLESKDAEPTGSPYIRCKFYLTIQDEASIFNYIDWRLNDDIKDFLTANSLKFNQIHIETLVLDADAYLEYNLEILKDTLPEKTYDVIKNSKAILRAYIVVELTAESYKKVKGSIGEVQEKLIQNMIAIIRNIQDADIVLIRELDGSSNLTRLHGYTFSDQYDLDIDVDLSYVASSFQYNFDTFRQQMNIILGEGSEFHYSQDDLGEYYLVKDISPDKAKLLIEAYPELSVMIERNGELIEADDIEKAISLLGIVEATDHIITPDSKAIINTDSCPPESYNYRNVKIRTAEDF